MSNQKLASLLSHPVQFSRRYDWCGCLATVDASVAGEGRLTVDVSLDGRLIPAHVTPGEPGRYHVGFVPDSPGVHQLRVYFAGVEISGKYG